jgi:methylmalonyl-CoA/ethylmalonyl-CoA epimerase
MLRRSFMYSFDMQSDCIKFHHFGLLSSEPEASCRLLAGLGYSISEPIDDPLQSVRLHWATHPVMPNVEVISPADTTGPVTNLAKKFQQGIYHLCFEVTDIQTCVDQLSVNTRVLEVSPPKPAILFQNRRVSFYRVQNLGLIELLEQG